MAREGSITIEQTDEGEFPSQEDQAAAASIEQYEEKNSRLIHTHRISAITEKTEEDEQSAAFDPNSLMRKKNVPSEHDTDYNIKVNQSESQAADHASLTHNVNPPTDAPDENKPRYVRPRDQISPDASKPRGIIQDSSDAGSPNESLQKDVPRRRDVNLSSSQHRDLSESRSEGLKNRSYSNSSQRQKFKMTKLRENQAKEDSGTEFKSNPSAKKSLHANSTPPAEPQGPTLTSLPQKHHAANLTNSLMDQNKLHEESIGNSELPESQFMRELKTLKHENQADYYTDFSKELESEHYRELNLTTFLKDDILVQQPSTKPYLPSKNPTVNDTDQAFINPTTSELPAESLAPQKIPHSKSDLNVKDKDLLQTYDNVLVVPRQKIDHRSSLVKNESTNAIINSPRDALALASSTLSPAQTITPDISKEKPREDVPVVVKAPEPKVPAKKSPSPLRKMPPLKKVYPPLVPLRESKKPAGKSPSPVPNVIKPLVKVAPPTASKVVTTQKPPISSFTATKDIPLKSEKKIERRIPPSTKQKLEVQNKPVAKHSSKSSPKEEKSSKIAKPSVSPNHTPPVPVERREELRSKSPAAGATRVQKNTINQPALKPSERINNKKEDDELRKKKPKAIKWQPKTPRGGSLKRERSKSLDHLVESQQINAHFEFAPEPSKPTHIDHFRKTYRPDIRSPQRLDTAKKSDASPHEAKLYRTLQTPTQKNNSKLSSSINNSSGKQKSSIGSALERERDSSVFKSRDTTKKKETTPATPIATNIADTKGKKAIKYERVKAEPSKPNSSISSHHHSTHRQKFQTMMNTLNQQLIEELKSKLKAQ